MESEDGEGGTAVDVEGLRHRRVTAENIEEAGPRGKGVKRVYAARKKKSGTAYSEGEEDASGTAGEGQEEEQAKRESRVRRLLSELPSRGSLWQAVKQNVRDVKRNKLNFCLGFMACFIVVFVVGLMVSILSHTPVVFLRLAESRQGEIDLVLDPHHTTGFDFINYTMVEELVRGQELYQYSSPRHQWSSAKQASLYALRHCAKVVSSIDVSSWAYTGLSGYTYPNCSKTAGACVSQLCGNSTTPTTFLMDSARELRMGLGKYFPMADEPAPVGSLYMSKQLADDLDVHTDDIVIMAIDLENTFQGLWNHTTDEFLASDWGESYSLSQSKLWKTAFVPMQIAYKFRDSYGKSDIDVEDGIYIEYSTFLQCLAGNLHPEIPTELEAMILSWDLYQYAGMVMVNYPPEGRYAAYTDNDMDVINRRFVDFTSDLCFTLGFNQISPEMPVLQQLNSLQVFSLFMGLILNVITFILLFLSVLLIYSLLMISVETRTFELGIYRMIGMSRGGVVQLLLVQAFTYAVPAWLCGLVLAEIGTVVASLIFLAVTGLPINAQLTFNAFLYASVLGIAIPIVSSVLPIRQALGQNLHDAIDVHRSKTKAVEVHVERSEDGGISWPLLLIGSFLAVFGFCIYYIIPLALLSEKLTVLLNIFFALLIMMLLGLVVLALNGQQLLEKAVVHLVFWFDKAAVRALVLKNMVAHRRRNRKTTVMYALSLGFIIFIYVSYDVQMKSIVYQEMEDHGTFLSVETDWPNRIDIVEELESWARRSDDVQNFCWRTHSLEMVVPNLKDLELTNLGHVYSDWTNVYGVSPNFFDVMLPGFLVVNEMDEGSPYPLTEQLYTPLGSASAFVGSLYKDKFAFHDLNAQFLVEASYSLDADDILTDADRRDLSGVQYYRMRPLAYLDGAPAFYFSQFPTQPNQHLLVSFTTYMRMSTGVISSMDDIPLANFHVQLPMDASDKMLDRVKGELKSLTSKSNYRLHVSDYRKDLEPLDDANTAMDFFFVFTVIVAMAISFFSLMSSMYTNILEQAKEIGVLRALGVPNGWLQRIYVYEAFTLVFAASFMGMMIGVVVGWTVALQRVLFTELPVPFEFPFALFGLMVLMAAVFAVISSYSPITMLTRKPIVQVLRMLS